MTTAFIYKALEGLGTLFAVWLWNRPSRKFQQIINKITHIK